jgi:hypothetical protein
MLQSAVAKEAYMMHIGTVYELSRNFSRRLWRENKVDHDRHPLSNLAGPLAVRAVRVLSFVPFAVFHDRDGS